MQRHRQRRNRRVQLRDSAHPYSIHGCENSHFYSMKRRLIRKFRVQPLHTTVVKVVYQHSSPWSPSTRLNQFVSFHPSTTAEDISIVRVELRSGNARGPCPHPPPARIKTMHFCIDSLVDHDTILRLSLLRSGAARQRARVASNNCVFKNTISTTADDHQLPCSLYCWPSADACLASVYIVVQFDSRAAC